jgi:O-antigen/teichoic acid export membrane protein
METSDSKSSLRRRLLIGGLYLSTRQALGVVVGLAGVIVLTRLIGPVQYGLYAAASALCGYLAIVAALGVDVYLIRRPGDLPKDIYDQAFTLLLISSCGLVGLALLAMPLVAHWYRDTAFIPPLKVLIMVIPVIALCSPARARLERALNYKAIAALELAAQIVFCTVSSVLAVLGFRVWAPVAGFAASQLLMLLMVCRAARFAPRFYLSAKTVRQILIYCLSYSASTWIWQARRLVNPFIVGRFVGAEGVAFVALAIRITEVLSFAKDITWRISIAGFARLRDDLSQLGPAIATSMRLQLFSVSPLLGAFSLLAAHLVTLSFGAKWMPILVIFPFFAASVLFQSLFNTHISALYVFERNHAVALFNSLNVAVLAAGAVVLVPRHGILGYAISEILTIVTYYVLVIKLKPIVRVSYANVWVWTAVCVPPVCGSLFSGPSAALLLLPAASLCLMGRFRKQVRDVVQSVMRSF